MTYSINTERDNFSVAAFESGLLTFVIVFTTADGEAHEVKGYDGETAVFPTYAAAQDTADRIANGYRPLDPTSTF